MRTSTERGNYAVVRGHQAESGMGRTAQQNASVTAQAATAVGISRLQPLDLLHALEPSRT